MTATGQYFNTVVSFFKKNPAVLETVHNEIRGSVINIRQKWLLTKITEICISSKSGSLFKLSLPLQEVLSHGFLLFQF